MPVSAVEAFAEHFVVCYGGFPSREAFRAAFAEAWRSISTNPIQLATWQYMADRYTNARVRGAIIDSMLMVSEAKL